MAIVSYSASYKTKTSKAILSNFKRNKVCSHTKAAQSSEGGQNGQSGHNHQHRLWKVWYAQLLLSLPQRKTKRKLNYFENIFLSLGKSFLHTRGVLRSYRDEDSSVFMNCSAAGRMICKIWFLGNRIVWILPCCKLVRI